MKISKKLVVQILTYLDKNKDFYFPFKIMSVDCRGDKGECIEIELDDLKNIKNNNYNDFELWENLQNLDKETLDLMAKGFLEKITGESLEKRISILARNYRKDWKEELWESEDIEEYGLNEFIGGKAEAYQECLELINDHKHIVN